MIDFDFDKWCCGCTSCVNACPSSAITMQSNDEGFLMPHVDIDKCIGCGKCDRSCPHLNTSEDMSGFSPNSFEGKPAYLYYSKQQERKHSASGGFVYDAMRYCINNNGIVCGCAWDEEMKAVHIVSDKMEDLHRMQSSKYVQSNMNSCFSDIKKALKDDRKVVFCGTPCQTAGLNHFLGKVSKDNLITISLICHGAASPLVWDKWVGIMESKYHAKLVNVNMRDKSYKGYRTSYSKYTFEDATKTFSLGMPTYLADPYIFLFTDNLFLRKSCNRCQYKADKNGADIIVGDFYASVPSAGNMGCSCVLAMTEKGDSLIKSLDGVLIQSGFQNVGIVNPMLWSSVRESSKRQSFFEDLKNEKVDLSLFKKYLPLRFKIKKLLNQIGVFNLYLTAKRRCISILK